MLTIKPEQEIAFALRCGLKVDGARVSWAHAPRTFWPPTLGPNMQIYHGDIDLADPPEVRPKDCC